MSLSVKRYLDTMLCHQRLGLLLDRGGAYRLVTFNPHRGLDSLGDFFVQLGADLHHFFTESNPPGALPWKGVAAVVADYYILGIGDSWQGNALARTPSN